MGGGGECTCRSGCLYVCTLVIKCTVLVCLREEHLLRGDSRLHLLQTLREWEIEEERKVEREWEGGKETETSEDFTVHCNYGH